jgi:arginine-tRNA-protein transferase
MKTRSDPLAVESTDFCMLDYPCAYLPDQQTRMHYRHVEKATSAFSSAVIQRGWRRFGNYFFYPICEGCNACKSIRINVDDFRPSRSQRRAIKRNRDTRVLLRKPTSTQQHIDLYNKYHTWKHEKDQWRGTTINRRDYYENFVNGAHDFGKEALYVRDNKLVGVDLFDIVDDGISSVYFFYDPDYARLSLGIYSLLYQIDLAKEMGLRYIYLGYWVDGCKAFAYKEQFPPEEILDGFPSLYETPNWVDWERSQRQSKSQTGT